MFDNPALRLGMNEQAETNRQREAVARLTTFCECIISAGQLPGATECELRLHVNAACSAFNMAPVQDRATREETCA